MFKDAARSQSVSRTRSEVDAELQPSKAAAVQRHAPAATRRQSVVQAKLSVGPADDVYEREADAVADQVVRSLAAPAGAAAVPDGPRAQRSATARSVSATVESAPRIGRVRRSATVGVDGGALDSDTEAEITSTRGGGRAMRADARSSMEGAFGADFGHIRIHEGSKASELNDRIQAKAFTVGSDIYFRDGAPDTSSREGQHLLAHELTHTVQQGGRVQRSTGSIQRHTDVVQRGFMDSIANFFGGKKKDASPAKGSEISGPTNVSINGQYAEPGLEDMGGNWQVFPADDIFRAVMPSVRKNTYALLTNSAMSGPVFINSPEAQTLGDPMFLSPKPGEERQSTDRKSDRANRIATDPKAAAAFEAWSKTAYVPEANFWRAQYLYSQSPSVAAFLKIYNQYVASTFTIMAPEDAMQELHGWANWIKGGRQGPTPERVTEFRTGN